MAHKSRLESIVVAASARALLPGDLQLGWGVGTDRQTNTQPAEAQWPSGGPPAHCKLMYSSDLLQVLICLAMRPLPRSLLMSESSAGCVRASCGWHGGVSSCSQHFDIRDHITSTFQPIGWNVLAIQSGLDALYCNSYFCSHGSFWSI